VLGSGLEIEENSRNSGKEIGMRSGWSCLRLGLRSELKRGPRKLSKKKKRGKAHPHTLTPPQILPPSDEG
jgi:hypothetical protein